MMPALVLAAVFSLAPLRSAVADRAIPEDNLAYPVLITLKNGGTGSGFYLNEPGAIYLVTAKHVLFDPASNKLRDGLMDALSYSKNLADTKRNLLSLDLATLNSAGNIKAHPTEDVVVVKIGVLAQVPQPQAQTPQPPKVEALQPLQSEAPKSLAISMVPGVTVKEISPSGLLGVDSVNGVKRFDQVLIGNEVVMFGYPTSLSLVQNPKIDFQRPLLRKGIVAGENPTAHSIILDCPAYQGDSGGPILEVESANLVQRNFRVIGVVSAFVPFADTWKNEHFNYTNTTLQNSGYSVVTPMDYVLELTK